MEDLIHNKYIGRDKNVQKWEVSDDHEAVDQAPKHAERKHEEDLHKHVSSDESF